MYVCVCGRGREKGVLQGQWEKRLTGSQLMSPCDLGACNAILPSIHLCVFANTPHTHNVKHLISLAWPPIHTEVSSGPSAVLCRHMVCVNNAFHSILVSDSGQIYWTHSFQLDAEPCRVGSTVLTLNFATFHSVLFSRHECRASSPTLQPATGTWWMLCGEL